MIAVLVWFFNGDSIRDMVLFWSCKIGFSFKVVFMLLPRHMFPLVTERSSSVKTAANTIEKAYFGYCEWFSVISTWSTRIRVSLYQYEYIFTNWYDTVNRARDGTNNRVTWREDAKTSLSQEKNLVIVAVPASWSSGLKCYTLNWYYEMRRWFEPRWRTHFRLCTDSVQTQSREETG